MISLVTISPEAWSRMQLYVECCDTEIGGLGLGYLDGSNFHLEETVLIQQWVTKSDTLLSPEGLACFLHEFVEAGGDPGRIKVWWHSHADHALRWSKQDEETIRLLNHDYLLSLIGNKAGEWVCRLDLAGPPAETVEPIAIEIMGSPDEAKLSDEALRKQIEKEIEEKVTTWEIVRLPGQGDYFFGTDVVTSDYSHVLESYGSFLLPWKGSQDDPGKGA
jgi:hypothetical protein